MDKRKFKAVPKSQDVAVKPTDPRAQIAYPISEITYSVWNLERRYESLIIKTTNLDQAVTAMESQGGKKKFAYIYYTFQNEQYFLCCTLDNKFRRQDFRVAVRKLLRPKEKAYYKPKKGLWAGRPSQI